ncbi:hypothetical protein [Sporosalibacterium faouarense]|uniref:hypothetical protein n=1 Tax=Sporosalibacterium faouarense TaxID=516123 RepID=UPI00141D1B85|nr:hypothetical protein [Sporosalibacterium faouarense]MTI47093.1 hypothetical protein [Bacillota bacterium]
MKKVLLYTIILGFTVSLLGCTIERNSAQSNKEMSQQENLKQDNRNDDMKNEEKEIENLVKAFGSQLQKVSLLAPRELVEKSIKENYGDFVSSTLLETWIEKPEDAPGRVTSSPWPDRIEISNIEQLSQGLYKVKGQIIEITSTEAVSGGIAASRPITLMVEKIDGNWLINSIVLGEYNNDTIVYINEEYGFRFSLPNSWKEYKIIENKWEGLAIDDSGENNISESGPIIYIRHPEWTSEKERQDIPIMIFTHKQWNSLQQEEFHIGAAPFGPSELGNNSKYVFALPARYNYAFPVGYEEVEDILNSNALQPIEVD